MTFSKHCRRSSCGVCYGATLSHVKHISVMFVTINGAAILLVWFLLLQQFMKSLKPECNNLRGACLRVLHPYVSMDASRPNRPIRQHPLSHARLPVHASPCNACVCQRALMNGACALHVCTMLLYAFVQQLLRRGWRPWCLWCNGVRLEPGRFLQPCAERHSQVEDSIGTTLRHQLRGMLPGQGHGSLIQQRCGIDGGEIAELCQGDAGDDV